MMIFIHRSVLLVLIVCCVALRSSSLSLIITFETSNHHQPFLYAIFQNVAPTGLAEHRH
jgi:hypothetical protein